MGEGGAVNIVKDMKLKVIVESFRDWGRDCSCPSGCDNTCTAVCLATWDYQKVMTTNILIAIWVII